MSKVLNNLITEGLSGKISDKYTFVQTTTGKTILKRIGIKKTEPTAAQLAQREKFKLVSRQADEALKDPEQRGILESMVKKGDTLRGTAFKHFYALIDGASAEE